MDIVKPYVVEQASLPSQFYRYVLLVLVSPLIGPKNKTNVPEIKEIVWPN